MKQPSLFDPPDEPAVPRPVDAPPDHAARQFAIEPRNDVVLEASAGTGKTRVLVDRYVRLIEEGVDPDNILAITFTRKAAAEMRERVLAALRRGAADRTRRRDGDNCAADWRSDLHHRRVLLPAAARFPLEPASTGFDVPTDRWAVQHQRIGLRLRS
jgi:hypothetical protein